MNTFLKTLSLFMISFQLIGQGLISEQENDDGHLLRIGSGFIGKKMTFTNQTIQADQFFLTFPGDPLPPPPVLKLNPEAGPVTIGNTDGDLAKLTIQSDDEIAGHTDLRLKGHGTVSTQGSFFFTIDDNNNANEYFSIKNSTGGDLFWIGENGFNYMSGNLAIGDQIINKHATGFKLSVDGKIMSEEVRVELDANWPDYVFAQDYELMSLESLEKEIQILGHLPGIPAASEVEAEGFELGNMNRLLLEKVEELTLHVIALNKQIINLKSKIIKPTIKAK